MGDYELIIGDDGSAILTMDGETMWTSDGDDTFLEAFGDEVIEDDDAADVLDFLEDEGYVPPGVDVRVIGDDGTEIPVYESDDDEEDDDGDV